MHLKWLLELVLLAAIWGSSFMFMRLSVVELGAFPMTFTRTVIATLFLGTILYFTRRKDMQLIAKHWKLLVLIALSSTAVPFCLWSFVSYYLESGPMAVLNATTPLFGALIAFVWLKEKLESSAIIGLFLGFIGVCVLMIVPQSGVSLETLPVLVGLMATTCYGIAANLTRAKAKGLPPMAVATGSQLFSSLVLAPFALYTWPEAMPSSTAVWSTVVLGIACTGFAFYMYFKMIAEQGITKTLSVTYLIPLFAILWGSLFLGEIIEFRTLLGGGFILLGVAFTTGYIRLGRKRLAETNC
ncbi:DMT family transporter [Paraneptunicella aestuarii]|uniref:DMT family transporter n=1 Tax=Paraneptunicella aestuarii TaxID=2831148 RepID=UPI001E358B61|nr:DMT family transporter [Paraneptunicella aestuarii]UAA39189.1 DMT family transporter [Paraneptunicella aestuarii]